MKIKLKLINIIRQGFEITFMFYRKIQISENENIKCCDIRKKIQYKIKSKIWNKL